MNLSNITSPHGLKLKQFRDIASSLYKYSSFSIEDIHEVLNKHQISSISTQNLFSYLLDNSLIQPSTYHKNKWQSTLPFNAFSGTKLTKRKNKNNAWLEVASAVARTVTLQITSTDWSFSNPSHIYLFGSMLNPNNGDYGDADLIVISERPIDKDNYFDAKLWTKKYSRHTQSRCWGEFGFSEQEQQLLDIKNSRSFLSFNDSSSPMDLIKQTSQYLEKEFPLMCLWSNHQNNKKEHCDIKSLNLLSDKWQKSESDNYLKSLDSFHQALKEINISPPEHPNFINECVSYVVNDLIKSLTKDPILSEYNFDYPLFNISSRNLDKVMRYGEIGFLALGAWVRIKNKELNNENLILLLHENFNTPDLTDLTDLNKYFLPLFQGWRLQNTDFLENKESTINRIQSLRNSVANKSKLNL